MDRPFLATVVAAVLLLAAGVGAGVYLGGTGAFDERPRVDPALTGFTAAAASCVADPVGNTTISLATQGEDSFLTIERNVTVPDTGHGLDAAFERTSLANYTLTVTPIDTDKPARECEDGAVPRAEFVATIQVPHAGNESYRVSVVAGDRRVATIRNEPGGLSVREADDSNRSARTERGGTDRGVTRQSGRSPIVPPPSPSHSTR
jgi:hypothetical protein